VSVEVRSKVVYGLPHNGKRLTDSVAAGEAPAVVYPPSVTGSFTHPDERLHCLPIRLVLRQAQAVGEASKALMAPKPNWARIGEWKNTSSRSR
jgi:hypothetical protein